MAAEEHKRLATAEVVSDLAQLAAREEDLTPGESCDSWASALTPVEPATAKSLGKRLSQTLDWDVDFALPYKSCQRGTNENTNGLIRDFFPKGTDFTRISHQSVARVENLLNERPRKRLGYKTPIPR